MKPSPQIANAPEFIKGVINLRGIIVPVVDMRIKFKLGSVTYNETTVVIILNVANRVVGMVVDGVFRRHHAEGGRDQATARIRVGPRCSIPAGPGYVDERMIILVDIEKLMTSHDMELMSRQQPDILVLCAKQKQARIRDVSAIINF